MTFRVLLASGCAAVCFGCASLPPYTPPQAGEPFASLAFVPQENPVPGAFQEDLRIADNSRCDTLRLLGSFNTADKGAARTPPRTVRIRAGETLFLSPIVEELYGIGHVRCASVVSFAPVPGRVYRVSHRYQVRPTEFSRVEFRCSASVVDELTGRPPPDLAAYPVHRLSRCISD